MSDSVVIDAMQVDSGSATVGKRSKRRWLRFDMLVVGVIGLTLRVLTALSTQGGGFNSDEAITGLTAISVLKGEFPLIVPGNDYGGVLEAYAFAPFMYVFRRFGPLAWGARLLDVLTICLHILLFTFLYLVIKRFAGRTAALLALILPWILSESYVHLASQSYLGYVAGPLASIASVWLCIEYERAESPSGRSTFKLLGAAFFAGVAFWQHPLAVLFPVCSFAYLAINDLISDRTKRASVIRRWLLVVVSFVVGALPEIIRLVQRRNDLRLATPPNPQPFITRLTYVFTLHLPRGLGLRRANGAWLIHSMDSWVPLAMGILVVIASVVVFLKGPRCLAVVPAGLILFAGSSATSFTDDGRYSLFILPILLLLVATGFRSFGPKTKPRLATEGAKPAGYHGIRTAALLALVGVVTGGAWMSMHTSLAHFRAQSERDVISIVRFLDEKHITNVRGAYWIVYRIGHVTSERIATSDFTVKRIDRLERRVAASSPQQLGWVTIGNETQPAEVVNNPDWPNTVVAGYRVYWYAPPAVAPPVRAVSPTAKTPTTTVAPPVTTSQPA